MSKDLQTVYVTAAQAGKGPDLVMGAHDWIGNLVQNGTIDPLQLTDDTRAAFNELAIQAVRLVSSSMAAGLRVPGVRRSGCRAHWTRSGVTPWPSWPRR